MLKALLKKQFLELYSFFFQDRKTGKNRSKTGIVFYIVLFGFIFFSLGSVFYGSASTLSSALYPMGLDWLYFTMMILITILLGVFGSVFSTYSFLYNAKDNDLLLSMPIPTSIILFTKLISIFFMGLMYEAVVFIPTLIAYFKVASFQWNVLFASILMLVLIGFVTLVLTCILGWLVAIIASKIKHKNIVIVILSLLFFGIYYYFCFRMYDILISVLSNILTIGSFVKESIYPLYILGNACLGNYVYVLISMICILIFTFITYIILSKTYLTIATKKVATPKVEYKEKKVNVQSINQALLHREFKRLMNSSTYLLNCGLGTILIPMFGIASYFMKDQIQLVLEMDFFPKDIIILGVCTSLCMLSCMNDLSAPSISLEGKSIWIVQSLPVPTKKVLDAKVNLQRILTIPGLIFSTVLLSYFLRLDILITFVILFVTCTFANTMALLGLVLNLLRPNLEWTNETAPVKQSFAVFVTLFGGWVIAAIQFFVGYICMNVMNALWTLILFGIIYIIISFLLERWIDQKGVKIFDTL